MTSQTLTEAANRLRISQPAVSKQIKQLQADLGFALFEKKGHRLVPTFEARAFCRPPLLIGPTPGAGATRLRAHLFGDGD